MLTKIRSCASDIYTVSDDLPGYSTYSSRHHLQASFAVQHSAAPAPRHKPLTPTGIKTIVCTLHKPQTEVVLIISPPVALCCSNYALGLSSRTQYLSSSRAHLLQPMWGLSPLVPPLSLLHLPPIPKYCSRGRVHPPPLLVCSIPPPLACFTPPPLACPSLPSPPALSLPSLTCPSPPAPRLACPSHFLPPLACPFPSRRSFILSPPVPDLLQPSFQRGPEAGSSTSTPRSQATHADTPFTLSPWRHVGCEQLLQPEPFPMSLERCGGHGVRGTEGSSCYSRSPSGLEVQRGTVVTAGALPHVAGTVRGTRG